MGKGTGTALYVVWPSADAREEARFMNGQAATYDRDEALWLLMELKRKDPSAYIAVHRVQFSEDGKYEIGFFNEFIDEVPDEDAVDLLNRRIQEAEEEIAGYRRRIADIRLGMQTGSISEIKPYFLAMYLNGNGWKPEMSYRSRGGSHTVMLKKNGLYVVVPLVKEETAPGGWTYDDMMKAAIDMAAREAGKTREEIICEVLKKQESILPIYRAAN